MIKSKDIVKELENLPQYQERLKNIERELALLQKEYAKLDETVRILSQVTDVINGVPLIIRKDKTIYGKDVCIYTAGEWKEYKWVKIYQDAMEKKPWYHMSVKSQEMSIDKCFFLNEPSLKKAKKIALDWITKGIEPERKYRKIFQR